MARGTPFVDAINQPMLAVKCEKKDWDKLQYPLIASPKLDGIRCLKVGGELRTRKWKTIPNHHVRALLTEILPEGIDGEIMVINEHGEHRPFNEISSAVMKREGTPTVEFWAFDYIKGSLLVPYKERLNDLQEVVPANHPVLKVIPNKFITSVEELTEYEAWCVANRFEGTMLRGLNNPFKNGRSTVKEGGLMKIKRFVDFEAEVIGFTEEMANNNEATKDAFGRTKRSSHKANKAGKGVLGNLIARTADGIEFEIGTGFTREQREEIWLNRNTFYLGKMVTVCAQDFGKLEKPRFPSFKGFRHPDDMGEPRSSEAEE